MRISIPIIGAVLAVLLVVGFYFLLYQPQVQQRAALQAETAGLKGEQLTLQAEIARLEAIRDDRSGIDAQLARIGQLVPPDVAQPSAIREFQDVAGQAGVMVRSVNFADPVPAVPSALATDGSQLASIATTMVLEGGYFQAVDFLRRLEQEASRAVLVQSLALAEGEETFPSLTTTLTGNLFALLPPGSGLPVPVPAETAAAATDPATTTAPPAEAP